MDAWLDKLHERRIQMASAASPLVYGIANLYGQTGGASS